MVVVEQRVHTVAPWEWLAADEHVIVFDVWHLRRVVQHEEALQGSTQHARSSTTQIPQPRKPVGLGIDRRGVNRLGAFSLNRIQWIYIDACLNIGLPNSCFDDTSNQVPDAKVPSTQTQQNSAQLQQEIQLCSPPPTALLTPVVEQHRVLVWQHTHTKCGTIARHRDGLYGHDTNRQQVHIQRRCHTCTGSILASFRLTQCTGKANQ